MQAHEFAQGYHPSLSDNTFMLTQPTEGVDLMSSRLWSNKFGEWLHGALNGEPIDGRDFSQTADSYRDWIQGNFMDLQEYIDADLTNSIEGPADETPDQQIARETLNEAACQAANEVNFHELNAAMLPNWLALVGGDHSWRGETRHQLISATQDMIALRGLKYYARREQVSGIDKNYEYFDPNKKGRRNMFEGRANEFDAAIVLLEIMKRREDLLILPAPIQFEKFGKTIDDKSTNVDFVALTTGGQALGLQVKGHVTAKVRDHYDPHRVAFIDAAADLGNERSMRTKRGSSDKTVMTWGGLICVQRVMNIKLTGPNTSVSMMNQQGLHGFQRRVLQDMFRAKQLAGTIKPHLQQATIAIKERIDHRLPVPATADEPPFAQFIS